MKKKVFFDNKGVTLIELLIAMAIGAIVSVAIFTVHESQVRTQTVQQSSLRLQQDMRSALMIMEREIRTAGADPVGSAGAGVITWDDVEFHFTRDIDDDAGTGQFDGQLTRADEEIRYIVNAQGHLARATGDDPPEILLENVDALDFVYLDQFDNLATNRNAIRTVEITIVARAGNAGWGWRHTDSESYTNLQGNEIFPPANDNERRLRMTTSVTCRNLGVGL